MDEEEHAASTNAVADRKGKKRRDNRLPYSEIAAPVTKGARGGATAASHPAPLLRDYSIVNPTSLIGPSISPVEELVKKAQNL